MRKDRLALFALLAAATAPVLGVRIFMGSPSQDRLAPQEHFDLATLRPPLRPPCFLACPPGYCAAPAGIVVPVFGMSWQRLRGAWTEMIAREPRVVRVAEEPDGRRLAYIQHSFLFRFPDIITVEFAPFGPDRSSLALYSRSRYGRYDFGQNRRRIETWLARLQALATTAAANRGVRS